LWFHIVLQPCFTYKTLRPLDQNISVLRRVTGQSVETFAGSGPVWAGLQGGP